jgi:hypothetical protein
VHLLLPFAAICDVIPIASFNEKSSIIHGNRAPLVFWGSAKIQLHINALAFLVTIIFMEIYEIFFKHFLVRIYDALHPYMATLGH